MCNLWLWIGFWIWLRSNFLFFSSFEFLFFNFCWHMKRLHNQMLLIYIYKIKHHNTLNNELWFVYKTQLNKTGSKKNKFWREIFFLIFFFFFCSAVAHRRLADLHYNNALYIENNDELLKKAVALYSAASDRRDAEATFSLVILIFFDFFQFCFCFIYILENMFYFFDLYCDLENTKPTCALRPFHHFD